MARKWKGLKKPEAVRAFIEDYSAVCAKHGMKVSKWETVDDSGFRVEALGPGERAVEEHGGARDLGFDEEYVIAWVEE